MGSGLSFDCALVAKATTGSSVRVLVHLAVGLIYGFFFQMKKTMGKHFELVAHKDSQGLRKSRRT